MKVSFRFLQLSGLVLAGFLALGLEMRPGQLSQHEAVFYRSEGQRLQKGGDLQGAQVAYQKALILFPNYADAHNDMGVILENRGDVDGAEASYRRALRIDPVLAAAHSNLALLYERLGRLEEAGQHWRTRVLLGLPEDPWVVSAREKLAKYNLPFSESPQEKQRQQVYELRQAFRTAELHMKARRWEEAAAAYRRILETAPTNEKADKGLQEAEKRWRWQREFPKKVVRFEMSPKEQKGRLEQERRKPKEEPNVPAQNFQTGRRKTELERAYEAGKIYLEAKRWDEAEREFDRALALDPTHEGAVMGLKEIEVARLRNFSAMGAKDPSVSSKSKEDAMEMALRNAAAITPPKQLPPTPLSVEAPLVSETAGPVEKKEAEQIAEQLTRQKAKTRHETVVELYQRGITAMRQARYEEAVTSFQQILVLEPNLTNAQQDLKRAQTALAKSKKS